MHKGACTINIACPFIKIVGVKTSTFARIFIAPKNDDDGQVTLMEFFFPAYLMYAFTHELNFVDFQARVKKEIHNIYSAS